MCANSTVSSNMGSRHPTDQSVDENDDSLAQNRKRSRSSKACVACHNRKIKCDLDFKPDNGTCSNCDVSDTECILYIRKKRSANRNKPKSIQICASSNQLNGKLVSNSNTANNNHNPTNWNHSFPNFNNISNPNSNHEIYMSASAPASTNTQNTSQPYIETNSNHNSVPNTIYPQFNSNNNQPNVQSTQRIPANNTTTTTPNTSSFHFIKEAPSKEKYKHLSSIKLDPMNVLKENMYDLMTTEFGLNDSSNPLMKKIFEKALGRITQDYKRSYSLDWDDYETLEFFGCFTLPDENTCWRYINNFFEYINPQLPIVDKKNFYETYTDLTKPPSLLLLYSVLFAGAWHANSDYTDANVQENNVQISKVFWKRARLLYEHSIETDPVPLIQSLLCFTFSNESMSNIAKNAYYWSHIAVSVAYQYGFHLKPPSNATPYRQKIQKRLWWLLYFNDRITCFGFSKPKIINLNQAEHDLLTLEDLANTGMSQPECLYLINLIKFGKLLDKIGSVQQEITRQYLNGRPVLNLMKKCDLIMIKYLRNISKEIRFKFNDKSTHSFLAIIIMSQYYTLLIIIHKANILRKCTDIYPSWAISFQAVQMIKMMGELLSSRSLVNRIAIIPHNSLTTCALIMSYHLLNEDKKIHSIAKEFFLTILDIWQVSYRKFPNVYPMLCIFAAASESDDYLKQIVKSVAPVNKRKRSRDSKTATSSSALKTESKITNKDSKTTESGTSSNEETHEEKLQDQKNLNLPDLTFFAKGDFKADGLSNIFDGTSAEFENLGVDFGKLFSESVFTNSNTLLPKLDLKSIIEPQPMKNSMNTTKPVTPQQSYNDSQTVSADSSKNTGAEFHAKHSPPGENHHNEDLNIHSKVKYVSDDAFLSTSAAFPEFNKMMRGYEDDVVNPSMENNNLQLPVSLWMMHTNWRPKFTVNTGENSDTSGDKSSGTPVQSNHQNFENNNKSKTLVDFTGSYNSQLYQDPNYNMSESNFGMDFNGKLENRFYANAYNFMGGFDPEQTQLSNGGFRHTAHLGNRWGDHRSSSQEGDIYPAAYSLHDSPAHNIQLPPRIMTPEFNSAANITSIHGMDTNGFGSRFTPSPVGNFSHHPENVNTSQSTQSHLPNENLELYANENTDSHQYEAINNRQLNQQPNHMDGHLSMEPLHSDSLSIHASHPQSYYSNEIHGRDPKTLYPPPTGR